MILVLVSFNLLHSRLPPSCNFETNWFQNFKMHLILNTQNSLLPQFKFIQLSVLKIKFDKLSIFSNNSNVALAVSSCNSDSFSQILSDVMTHTHACSVLSLGCCNFYRPWPWKSASLGLVILEKHLFSDNNSCIMYTVHFLSFFWLQNLCSSRLLLVNHKNSFKHFPLVCLILVKWPLNDFKFKL